MVEKGKEVFKKIKHFKNNLCEVSSIIRVETISSAPWEVQILLGPEESP